MARAIWTGSISFGLVNVPVKVFSAVHQHDLHFNQFGPKGERIRYKRISDKTGKEVDYGDIQKGYETAKGKFVLLDPAELEAFEPRATRTIEIEDFVDLDAIDPVYFENTYYLAPGSGTGNTKAYSLLFQAMEKQNKVAIGKVVMRTKQYLAAIRPFNGALGMSTMLFADEVVPPREIGGLVGGNDTASDREVKMASQIIDSLSTDWDPARYRDTYTDRVMEYIEQKGKGQEVKSSEETEQPAPVTDLMAALEASLAEAKKARAPAKQTSASKSPKSQGTKKRRSA